MTVITEDFRSDHVGNDVTVDFVWNFNILEEEDCEVYLDQVLQASSEYTLTGLKDPMGGTVTFNTAPGTGVAVSIIRNVPYTQEKDYQAFTAFPAASHEEALDKAMMAIQQVFGDVGRSIKVNQFDPNPAPILTADYALPNRAGLTLQFTEDGSALETVAPFPNGIIKNDPLFSNPSEVSATSEDAIKQYVDNAVAASINAVLHFNWNFDTNTDATDPGAGNFKYDNGTPASVTNIYISATENDGVDVNSILSLLTETDQIFFQSTDAGGEYLFVEISGAVVDNTGWYTIPVTVLDSGTLHGNGDDVRSMIFFVSNLTPPKLSKAFWVPFPTDDLDMGIWTPESAVTIQSARAYVVGTTPSLTFNIVHAANANEASPNQLWAADQALTSEVGVTMSTSFSDDTVASDAFVRMKASALGGEVTGIFLELRYTED